MEDMVARGSCLCGAVAFDVSNIRDTVTFCHCSQCRKFSGHHWAATRAPQEKLSFRRDDGLVWFASSDFAKRGFCRICGSSLFYKVNDADHIGIAAGCLESPTGLRPGKHIFTANQGDYYTIADDAPHVPD
jgi:hypothetical protein